MRKISQRTAKLSSTCLSAGNIEKRLHHSPLIKISTVTQSSSQTNPYQHLSLRFHFEINSFFLSHCISKVKFIS